MGKGKFRYLFQLAFTSILLVIVPVLLFYCVIWTRSYKEITELNAEYYTHSLSTFGTRFTEVIEKYKNHVITFSVNSKVDQNELVAFYYGTPKMKEYAYYFGEAATKLRKYEQEIGYDSFGVYYYDEDILLVDGSKYSCARYLEEKLQVSNENKKLFEDFYAKEKYQYNKVMYAPIYDAEGRGEKLLLGVCTVLGKEREEAILFCQIGPEDLGLSYASLERVDREKYYVIDNDKQKILFSVGASQKECDFLEQELKDLVSDDEYALEELPNFIFKKYPGMNITFAVDMAGDIVQTRVVGLYQSVKYFFIYIAVIMLFIGGVVIYFNYRPINTLLKEINADDKYEFEAILHSWRNQEEVLSEQRMFIMDLLMNQLIYGVPISKKHVKKLGISSEIRNYCVFVIEDYILKVSETENVIQDIEETFETLLFVTDIGEEKSTVLIALMKEDLSEELWRWLECWTEKNISEKCCVKKGRAVCEINEIHHSFKACLEKDNMEKELILESERKSDKITVLNEIKNRAVINNRLKEKVLDYLEEHFTESELSQQQLADSFQVSVYTLSKMFNNQIGIGFSEYLNSKRIEYAKELLVTTDVPVKKIATMAGIPNDNYFSKIFKKYTGVSPAMYREERSR